MAYIFYRQENRYYGRAGNVKMTKEQVEKLYFEFERTMPELTRPVILSIEKLRGSVAGTHYGHRNVIKLDPKRGMNLHVVVHELAHELLDRTCPRSYDKVVTPEHYYSLRGPEAWNHYWSEREDENGKITWSRTAYRKNHSKKLTKCMNELYKVGLENEFWGIFARDPEMEKMFIRFLEAKYEKLVQDHLFGDGPTYKTMSAMRKDIVLITILYDDLVTWQYEGHGPEQSPLKELEVNQLESLIQGVLKMCPYLGVVYDQAIRQLKDEADQMFRFKINPIPGDMKQPKGWKMLSGQRTEYVGQKGKNVREWLSKTGDQIIVYSHYKTQYTVAYKRNGEDLFHDHSAKSRSKADQTAFRMMIKYGEYKK